MYFEKSLNNFGVVLKGSSVENLPRFSSNFQDCFIVNNIDKNADNSESEYSIIAPEIKGKNIAHFVNRLPTAPLLPEHYKELEIKNIQFPKVQPDAELSSMKLYYESLGLTCHNLPEQALGYNDYFDDKFYLKPGDSNYKTKHPNTGVLAVIYAASILKPKNLWVIGLDFYQSNYLFRRPWHNSFERQQLKMKNTDMVGHFMDIVKRNPDVNFKMVTYAELGEADNLEIMPVERGSSENNI